MVGGLISAKQCPSALAVVGLVLLVASVMPAAFAPTSNETASNAAVNVSSLWGGGNNSGSWSWSPTTAAGIVDLNSNYDIAIGLFIGSFLAWCVVYCENRVRLLQGLSHSGDHTAGPETPRRVAHGGIQAFFFIRPSGSHQTPPSVSQSTAASHAVLVVRPSGCCFSRCCARLVQVYLVVHCFV